MNFHKTRLPTFVLFVFLSMPALAELPDAARFGVSMEIGDTGAAQRWLDEGLDPDFLADRVGTGMMLGAWEGNIALMELFLQHGANINALNRQGEQALQLAAWKGNIEAVKWLLDHGASINRNGAAWSALHYAAFAGQEKIVRLLIDRGGDVNARTPNGSSVLMMAAHEGHEDIVQPLLDAGADPAARNENGDTALSWAMRYGNFNIAERVSTREAFAAAARAPLKSWGPATRSVAAPNRINELMRRIRLMEASGQNTDKLRKALHAAVEDFKKGSLHETIDEKAGDKDADKTMPPRALVITAKRSKPGQEKAEQIAASAPQNEKATAISAPRSRVADLLYQMRQAEAEGKPTEALRQELIEAVSSMQK